APPAAAEVSVRDLAAERKQGRQLVVIDVRELHEIQMAAFPGALHIPLRQLPARLAELDPHLPLVTLCHTGMRSLKAREILMGAGFGNVRSVAGGIDAWSREIDPAIPRY